MHRLAIATGFTLASQALALLLLEALCAGQTPRFARNAETHARACVGELGWSADEAACRALVEVHVRRSEILGTSPESVARRYSRALRNPPYRRRWVGSLTTNPATIPVGWPVEIEGRWPAFAGRFSRLRDVARETLSNMQRNPVGYAAACPGALHYGSIELDGTPTGFELACSWRVGRNHQGFYRRIRR